MKQLKLPSYHLFEHKGLYFAFDVEKVVALRIDRPAYDFLEAMQASGSAEEAMERLTDRYEADVLSQLAQEVAALQGQGYLVGPVTGPDEEDFEQLIARLVKKSTGNIELYLAEACNMRCKYCYVGENDALHNGLMPSEVARAAVDLVFRRSRGVPNIQITFFGGEPLLNKPVMREVIAYSQMLGQQHGKTVRYSLTTNATLLDDEVIGYIKQYNFGLMISLDGPPEIQNEMRPMADGSGSFDQVARNVKRLMRRRKRVTVRCTISNRHLNLVDIVEFLEGFGFTRVGLSRCDGKSYRTGEYDIGPEEYALLEEQYERLLERYLRQIEQGEELRFDQFTGGAKGMHKPERAPLLRCGVCRGCTTVGVDGKLYPCHRYVGMEKYVVGDVWTGVDEQKHADYLREYFKTKKKCETCWAIHYCGGMCPWFVSHEDGTSRPPKEWRCEGIRRSLQRSAWLHEYLRENHPEFFASVVADYDERELISRGEPTAVRRAGAGTLTPKVDTDEHG